MYIKLKKNSLILATPSTMKFELLFLFIFTYNCVKTIKVDGFEFQDNKATTHITEENGIASTEFLVIS